MKILSIKSLGFVALSAMLYVTVFCTPSASAAGFEAGRIIDDAVMANSQSMNVSQIQAFLNSKVPVCDNWGTNGSTPTSRRDYFNSRGWPIPLTCLKDYTENGKSSAQIIYDAAQEYTINPQVLIVLLQKEQGLVTDDWPDPTQYRSATGYGCPDTAVCDSLYYGFTNQIRNAAKMFRRILDASPYWYTPYVLGNNYIQYSPDPGCGGTWVNIQNRATQGLYNYTPYQPNQASLNAGYGSGDYCSSYGNRNFYLYFTSWFGSTLAINSPIILSKQLMINDDSPLVGDVVTASYEVSNSASYDIQAGGFGVCARLDGINYDFGFITSNIITASGKKTISFSKKIDKSGTLNIFICSYLSQMGGWVGDRYPYNINILTKNITLKVQDNPLITTSVSLSPTEPAINQPVTATFAITNSGSSPVDIGKVAIAVRDPDGKNADFPPDIDITIQANSTYTFSKQKIFTKTGKYTFFFSNYKNGVWDSSYPKSMNNSIIRSGSFTI